MLVANKTSQQYPKIDGGYEIEIFRAITIGTYALTTKLSKKNASPSRL